MCQYPRGTVEFSSGDEGLVRPNVGRDVAAKTVASVHQVPTVAVDGERCPAVFPMAQGEVLPSPRFQQASVEGRKAGV